MAAKQATTKGREKRNRLIKMELQELLASGYSMKEASYLLADKYYLSQRQVLRIYYETVER